MARREEPLTVLTVTEQNTGTRYDLDWPYVPGLPAERNLFRAAVYKNGNHAGFVQLPGINALGRGPTRAEVIQLGMTTIMQLMKEGHR